jgi:hypothetical protein
VRKIEKPVRGKVDGMIIPLIAGTSIFQDALSGLQQLQTISQGFAFGGTGNLLTTNGLANIASGGAPPIPSHRWHSSTMRSGPMPRPLRLIHSRRLRLV